jgi:hypothetical protein
MGQKSSTPWIQRHRITGAAGGAALPQVQMTSRFAGRAKEHPACRSRAENRRQLRPNP